MSYWSYVNPNLAISFGGPTYCTCVQQPLRLDIVHWKMNHQMLPWETLANHKPIEMVRSWAHVQSRLYIISYRWIYFVIPMIFPFWLVHSYYSLYIPMKFSLHSHTFPKTHSHCTYNIHFHIPIIFYYISIMFPLYSHYFVPTSLCYLHDIIYSHYITTNYVLHIYIYTYSRMIAMISLLYPIISYYIYISSTHYIIEL